MLLSSFSRLAFRAPLSRPFSSQSSAHANQSSSSNSSKRWIGIASVLVAGCVGFAMSERHSFFAKEQESPQDPLLSPNAFKSFTLEEVVPVNHNTKIFRFALPLDRSLDLPLTSCVVVGFTDSEGKVVTRPYTPISKKEEKGHFDLIIKKYPNGPMSTHIHDLKKGEQLEVKGPFSKIPLKPNMKKKIGMVAGGTGIAPMLQVIYQVLDDPTDKTELSLIFANVSEEDILLKEELDRLAKRHSNFHVFFTLDKPSPKWRQGQGFVSKEMIQSHLPPPSDDNLILICGPNPMLNLISGPKGENFTQGPVGGLLKDLGFNESQVFKF